MTFAQEKFPSWRGKGAIPAAFRNSKSFAASGLQWCSLSQTPKEVLIIWRGDSQFRHVYLNVLHSQNPKPSWYGESVGHYEGDTLVVDTIGLSTKTFVDNYRTPHTWNNFTSSNDFT